MNIAILDVRKGSEGLIGGKKEKEEKSCVWKHPERKPPYTCAFLDIRDRNGHHVKTSRTLIILYTCKAMLGQASLFPKGRRGVIITYLFISEKSAAKYTHFPACA